MNAIKYDLATGEIVGFLTLQNATDIKYHSDATFGCLVAPEVPFGSTAHWVSNGTITMRPEKPSQDHKWSAGAWVLDTAKATERLTRELRKQRDEALAKSDWVVTFSLEAGIPVPENWVTYRQALRDLPEQAGFPFNAALPEKPQ